MYVIIYIWSLSEGKLKNTVLLLFFSFFSMTDAFLPKGTVPAEKPASMYFIALSRDNI